MMYFSPIVEFWDSIFYFFFFFHDTTVVEFQDEYFGKTDSLSAIVDHMTTLIMNPGEKQDFECGCSRGKTPAVKTVSLVVSTLQYL